MKRLRRIFLAALVSAALVPAARVGAAVDEAELPMEDVRLPIEHYEDGTLKTQISARRAKIPAVGEIVAAGVRIELYAADGSLETAVDAETCRYDRGAQVAYSDGAVRMDGRGVVITGVGFRWQAADGSIRILRDAKVAFRRKAIKGLAGSGWKRKTDE